MDLLQWAFIVGVSLGILSLIFTLYFVFSHTSQRKKIKQTATTRTKNKRKKKKMLNQLSVMKKNSQKTFRCVLLFSLLSVAFSGMSYYVTYYQATNLSAEDTQNITDGFYYLRDLKGELEEIQDGSANEESSKQTLAFIVTSLAGYSVKKANTLNTTEGQSVLNRYYNAMSELGINVSRRGPQLANTPEILKESLDDIDKVMGYQTKAFTFFKVDESVLQAEK
ncbi:hypothetical protein [uncultured Vagococcus sp.]|uniref:hypothetical protein n=1 Tax=uncultured Vagococcus sp. TaxID=189676 RepID=UPI0028D45F12|nr:hypothetical protein [uncultured Vagococcus sp.]